MDGLQAGPSDVEMANGDAAPGGAPEGSMQSVLDSTPAAAAPKPGRGRRKGKAAAAPRGAKGLRGKARGQRASVRGRAGRKGLHHVSPLLLTRPVQSEHSKDNITPSILMSILRTPPAQVCIVESLCHE